MKHLGAFQSPISIGALRSTLVCVGKTEMYVCVYEVPRNFAKPPLYGGFVNPIGALQRF